MPTKSKKKTEPVIEPLDPEPYVDVEDNMLDEQPEDTVTFKRSHFYSVLTVLAFAVGVLVGYVVWGFGTPETVQVVSQPSGAVAEAPITAEPQFIRYDVPSDGFPSIGPADAPITIVEFSDYQCPFCRRWHEDVYEPLLAAYPGQIKLVYRHLPLTSIHPDAMAAAEAAMCAGEQDAYWPYHEKLFGSETLGNQTYVQYAQDLSLNMETFESCLTEHRYQAEIESDSNFATDLGVRSTPTFFINGLALVGAQPLDVFKQIIDKELAGEIPQ
jgi:protein-disulfide isomerase